MSQSKVYSESDGNISVPFKWEKQPGVSKLIMKSKDRPSMEKMKEVTADLPLPPCRSQKALTRKAKAQTRHPHSWSFQDPVRSCSKRGFGKQASSVEKDPFLMAFKECTKTKSAFAEDKLETGVGLMIRKSLLRFSCKQPGAVRDDALVRIGC